MLARHAKTIVTLSLALLVARVPAADALVLYSSSIGWRFASTRTRVDEGYVFKLDRTEPSTSGVRGLFLGRNGGFCPAPGTPDFLCAEAYSAADSEGGRLTLHSSVRLVRSAGVGVNSFAYDAVYADTTIQILNLGVVGVAPPVAYAYVVFGLHGTVSQTLSDPSVTAQAFSYARLDGMAVQCAGTTTCEPVRMQNWTPQLIRLNLRTDVAVSAPTDLIYDADLVADFADTFELLAIELHDENDEPIPGASVVVTDGNGTTLFTIPNTVETTTTTTSLPPEASTTTTAPGATTTTTTLAGGTTTTTLPNACPDGATLGAIACRLEALAALVPADAGDLGAKLLGRLATARAALAAAENGGAARQVGKALKKVRKALAGFGRTLRSRRAQRLIPEPTRTRLRDASAQLIADVRALSALDLAGKQGEGAARHEHRTSRWNGSPGPRARHALGGGG